jgi:hypothetical protein
MAIALDAAVGAVGATDTPKTLTFAHTVGTGENRLLAVFASCYSMTCTVSGVTYNGVSMASAGSKAQSNYDHGTYGSIWLLAAPASGTHNVVITYTEAYVTVCGVASSYTGCSQTSTKDAFGSGSGTSSGTKTFTVTTVANNCWIFAGALAWYQDTTASQTGRYHNYASYKSSIAEDTNAAQTPAGAKTMGAVFTSGVDCYAMVGASFAPYVATASVGLVGQGLVGSYSPLSKGMLM